MLPAGGRVVVALSGGPDSVALLHVLLALQARGELVVAGVAHFNHGLRSTESDADEEFCRALAASLELPYRTRRGDVRARAAAERRSIEDAARASRYEFLTDSVRELNASAVAIGHTLDDQAETFLLRLIRGAGSRGLAGIRPKNGVIIRPLLEVRRTALREYAEQHQLAFRIDESNGDVAIPRNRIRHELIPLLERDYSSGIVEVLAREADAARLDEEKLQTDAIDLSASIVLSSTPPEMIPAAGGVTPVRKVSVDAAALSALHPALAARVAREALEELAGERFIGADHLQRFLEFASAGAQGTALSLPGQQAVRDGNRVILGPEPPRGVEQRANSFQFSLSIPGELVLTPQGFHLQAAWGDPVEGLKPQGTFTCSVAGVRLPLWVRSRKPGDRFQPPGMGGKSRKLQDYLVDRKVARADRDRLPLVVDGDDRIVWIVGHAVAHDFRVTAASHGVIFLKARRLGGEG